MGFMLDRIDDELKRQHTIDDRIQIAVCDAIDIYAQERFRFNETFTTTFLTTGGQQNYNIFSDINFPAVQGPIQVYHIDFLTITIPPAVFDMPRVQPEEILILTQTGTQMGQPYIYSFMNENIMIYPVPPTGTPGTGPVTQLGLLVGGTGYTPGVYAAVPAVEAGAGSGTGLVLNVTVNSFGQVQATTIANGGFNFKVGDVITTFLLPGGGSGFQQTVTAISTTGQGPFLMTVGGHVHLAAPMQPVGASGADVIGNRWFTDGEKLIRSRAKFELAINVLRDPDLARLMSPFAPEYNGGMVGATYDAYEAIQAQANRMNSMGRIRPILF